MSRLKSPYNFRDQTFETDQKSMVRSLSPAQLRLELGKDYSSGYFGSRDASVISAS